MATLVGLLFFLVIGICMLLVMKACGSSCFHLFDRDVDESILDEGGQEQISLIDDDEMNSYKFNLYPRSYINIYGETVYINWEKEISMNDWINK